MEPYTTFNRRFTELVNEMDGPNKLTQVSVGTSIPETTLKKYYLSKNDLDKNYVDGNHSDRPRADKLPILAKFFGVDPLYLTGDSDIRNPNLGSIEDILKDFGLTGAIVNSMELLKTIPEQEVYTSALLYLLWDLSPLGEGETPRPLRLLYLLGRYLTRLSCIEERRIPSHIIEEAALLLSRPDSPVKNRQDYATILNDPEYIHFSDEDDHLYLENIKGELQRVRKYLDNIEQEILKISIEEEERSPGFFREIIEETHREDHE